MNLKTSFLVSILSISLLSSQLGFNIFLAYCCCAKNSSYSFVPNSDRCHSKKQKTACCNTKPITKTLSFKKSPCSSKVIDHKSLLSRADKPASLELVSTDFQFQNLISKWTLENKKSFLSKFSSPFSESYKSGIYLRKIYCSLIC